MKYIKPILTRIREIYVGTMEYVRLAQKHESLKRQIREHPANKH
jgi:hypothetical protein